MPSPTTVVNGIRANFGVSDCGQLMGKPTEAALASIEPEGTYEHLAVGVLEEGFTLCYMTPGAPITLSGMSMTIVTGSSVAVATFAEMTRVSL